MKKTISVFLSVVLIGIVSAVPAMAAEVSYADVPEGSWFSEAVNYTTENGLFSGTGENQFNPNGVMTRGMFVTALGRMDGVSADNEKESTFSDVKPGAYYTPYVLWASENGIVNGMGDGTFEPNANITREQMCTIFVRFLKEYKKYDLSEYEGSSAVFADADEISSWAASEVSIAQKMGLVEGSEQNGVIRFSPKDPVTRAAAATIVMRLDKTLEAGTLPEQPGEEQPGEENPGTGTPGTGGGGGTGTPGTDPGKPNPPEYTEEEIAEESEIAGYIANICEKYPASEYAKTVDQEVRDCMDLLTDCMNKGLQYRENGGFLSSEYVRTTYEDDIEQFKSMYSALTEKQKTQLQNVVARLETEDHIYKVLSYFGVADVNF